MDDNCFFAQIIVWTLCHRLHRLHEMVEIQLRGDCQAYVVNDVIAHLR